MEGYSYFSSFQFIKLNRNSITCDFEDSVVWGYAYIPDVPELMYKEEELLQEHNLMTNY